MSKLTYEDKLEIIKLKERGISYNTISLKYHIHADTVYKIGRLFRLHGKEALKVKKQHKVYSASEKLLIIKEVFNGNSLQSTAIKYQISVENIRNWINIYNKWGYDGLKKMKKGRPPTMSKKKVTTKDNDNEKLSDKELIKQQQERILELEIENAAIKKWRALTQIMEENEEKMKRKP